MRYVLIIILTCYSITAKCQDLAALKDQLYSRLNSHHGWGLNAFKDNAKTDIFYTTNAWFNFSLDNKLEYSKTEVAIVNNKVGEPKTYTTSMRFTDIKSFEYKEVEYQEYSSKNSSALNQEKLKTPILIINYSAGGEIHKLTLGYQLKGEKNIIQELNQLIKEIQSKLK